MNGNRVFLDTNIAIYAYSKADRRKQNIARTVIIEKNCFVSSQVLNEFCSVCIKKLNMDIEEIRVYTTDLLSTCRFVTVKPETVEKALYLHKAHQFNFYDCLMVASALESGCDYLFTEDLQDGQVIDGLTIQNIFTGELP
jgi:predicted nucleic acid-binding protein